MGTVQLLAGLRTRRAAVAAAVILVAVACAPPTPPSTGTTTTTSPTTTTSTSTTTSTTTTTTTTTTTSTSTTTTTTTTPPGPAITYTEVNLACRATFLFITQDTTMTVGLTTIAPSSVASGSGFAISITADPIPVPTSGGGQTINYLSNLIARFKIPAGSTYQSATIVGGSNLGSGTPTITTSGGNVVLTVPGRLNGGTTATLPTVTANFTASGAPGSTIVTNLGGSSYGNPGFSFNANTGLGNVQTNCYANPNPGLSTTNVT